MAHAVCFGGPLDGHVFEVGDKAKSVTIESPYVPPSWSPKVSEVHLHVYDRLDATHFIYRNTRVKEDSVGT